MPQPSRQTPLLRFAELTERWKCLTRYRTKKRKDGTEFLEALEQYDVHDQIVEILRQHDAAKIETPS